MYEPTTRQMLIKIIDDNNRFICGCNLFEVNTTDDAMKVLFDICNVFERFKDEEVSPLCNRNYLSAAVALETVCGANYQKVDSKPDGLEAFVSGYRDTRKENFSGRISFNEKEYEDWYEYYDNKDALLLCINVDSQVFYLEGLFRVVNKNYVAVVNKTAEKICDILQNEDISDYLKEFTEDKLDSVVLSLLGTITDPSIKGNVKITQFIVSGCKNCMKVVNEILTSGETYLNGYVKYEKFK